MMATVTSELHQMARRYAEDGLPVFPCWPGTKVPAVIGGFHKATTDLKQIDEWWSKADYNIGFSPNSVGWSVVDVEKEALDLWSLQDAPETFTVATPRGGAHYYFEGSLPSRVKTLLPGAAVDTRGVGGYVLLPPSVVEGKPYELVRDVDLQPLPSWVEAAAHRRAEKIESAGTRSDDPGNIARGRDHVLAAVQRGRVAVEGQGGDATTFNLAAELRDLGLSEGSALALLEDHWNDHCLPPWTADELRLKVHNAFKYASNGEGAFAVKPASELFASVVKEAETSSSRFRLETEAEMDVETPVEWLIPDILIKGTTAMLVGKTQSYKSYLVLDMCLSIASGIGYHGMPCAHGPVVYAGLEGMRSIRGSRRRAWRQANGIDQQIPNFFTARAPLFALDAEVQEFGDQIKRTCGTAELVVIDTLAKSSLGLDIMHHADASKVVRFAESLVEAGVAHCVLMLHHVGKDDSKGAMGSAALHAGFDTVLTVKSERKHWTELTVSKHKDAAEAEFPFTYKAETVADDLVFRQLGREEAFEERERADPLSTGNVGAALRAIGAVGGVTVGDAVLAAAIVPQGPNDSPDEMARLVVEMSGKLRNRKRYNLKAYVDAKGQWGLP